MAAASKTQCTIIFNQKGAPVKCVSGKVSIEKAHKDIAKMEGYSIKETPKARCPFCTPRAKESGHAQESEPVAVTLLEAAPDEVQAGFCQCGGYNFKLMFVNHIMVRECRTCGEWFNLHTSKPWGE